MQGIDIFDMRPLPSDRIGMWFEPNGRNCGTHYGAGTFEDPVVVRSAGDELQVGCTGVPADSHVVRWAVVCRSKSDRSKSTHFSRYRSLDHSSDATSAAVFTRWNTSDQQMTHMITITMDTRSQRLWRTTSSQNTGTDELYSKISIDQSAGLFEACT